MTGRLLLCLALLASAGAGGFYDPDRVGEIRLTFAEPNWDWILDSLYAAGEEGRLVGTATVDGVRFDSVGVRYKGASSYNPSRRKNPLNIKLDHVRPGQAIDGHGTLRLANVYKDPSFVREVLAYEIARRYMPAGRANFVNVWVNDTLIGLYTNNEDPDRRFMREHFFGDDNARFKGRLTDSSQMIGWKYLGPDSSSYRHYFELDSDSGWSELVAFLDTFNHQPEAMGRVLAVDRHLWMLAFDALLVNLDAPINMPQNYYLYRDPSRRFNPVVWDLNESFGAYRDLNGTGILSVTQMQQLDPFLRQGDTNYPIAAVTLADARRRRMYAAHLKTILAETFANNWYRDRALEVQDIIDAHVQADRNKFYTYNDFLNNITRSVGTGPLAIVGLTELMGPRATWILSRPEFAAPGPTIGEVTVAPARPVPGSSARFEVTVAGADSVFLGWRQSPAAAFERVAMADAGGGVYSAAVRLAAGDVEYYVYAEDSVAGAFAPPRAEYECYSLPVTGDVVLNELMAQNVSTARDPAGDYDDWVELYNNSDRAVSLDGFLLTDDSTDILKWQFPDTTIPARGYLVVWCDAETLEPGVHASFTLAAGGEMLAFFNDDADPLDRVVFGQQYPDISFGRFPNGTGEFRLMNPTLGQANDSAVGIEEPARKAAPGLALHAWPNPVVTATLVRFSLPEQAHTSLRVYDAAGRAVQTFFDAELAAGSHEVRLTLPGGATPGGVYFARLAVRGADGTTRTAGLKLVRAR